MKYSPIILFLSFLTYVKIASGQTIKKDKGAVNSETFSYCYMEPKGDVKGILVLLPGWGESPQSIFEKTALPHLLAEKGFVTIVPQLHQALLADDYTLAQVSELIAIQSKRYNSNSLHFILGGLSAGGAIAIGYAEHFLASDSTKLLHGVFAIDPPLDLNRMYKSAENKLQYECQNKLIRKEGDFIKKYLLRIMNGSPAQQPDRYLKYSAFSANKEDGGNAKLLKSIPVRLYSEPDLDFVRKTYCEQLQYEDINAFDLEKLSKFLAGIGNQSAEYITTKGKGFHSWNILDAVDCANWIVKITSENKNDGSTATTMALCNSGFRN
ncbi:alpha/beta hydrolase [Segetibacter aerophilus]|uniref:Alpha/beta hydrolase n=1 Tax=Segetibacter aerophilus TaxID=670293 RepID=A0A512BJJ3_9BACT|nr:alpha/beta hydrolase [Segetibacter aerophilus]GEO12139.1 hypothetical protein SAE01_46350 [Segetibacter aerophilus]